MSRCPFCRRRVWFWQRQGFRYARASIERFHTACYTETDP